MNKTPLLEFVYNRKKTAATNREAAVELRITFERKQKYMTTGIRLLPKHWHRGAVVNRIDARELNETLEKLMAEVRQVILDMMSESVMDIFSIQERLKRKRASAISFLEFCELWRYLFRGQKNSSEKLTRVEAFHDLIERQYAALQQENDCIFGSISSLSRAWHWDRDTTSAFITDLEKFGAVSRYDIGKRAVLKLNCTIG